MALPEVNSERWLSLEDLPGEVWKRIPIESKRDYYASNIGRIKVEYYTRKEHNIRIIRQTLSPNGYLKTGIDRITYSVHRLIALTFIPNPENKPEIDHINTKRSDNNITNLRWVTRTENMRNPLNKNKVKLPSILPGTPEWEKLREEYAAAGCVLLEPLSWRRKYKSNP